MKNEFSVQSFQFPVEGFNPELEPGNWELGTGNWKLYRREAYGYHNPWEVRLWI
jgi:hypothetical protein